MRVTQRYEYKYRLDTAKIYPVRYQILASGLERDYYSKERPYFVRSLYFDTDDYHSLFENRGGLCSRVKLRIRSYSPIPADPLSVELKTKAGNFSLKYSTFISCAWYETFMETGHFPANDDPVLIEFERLVHLLALKPKVIIEYEREGLRPRRASNLRITIDRGIRSAAAGELFPAAPAFRVHYGRGVILEIKSLGKQPRWLNQCVREHGLRWVANSKYVQSIALSRPDVIAGSSSLLRMPVGGLAADARIGLGKFRTTSNA
ncbi:MAG: polyphosphate polymerase domain-containing protein [Firmicutes bacterium]|nr:polyphosphate polymerase domain-containing protein [Bacillota bacterium]NLL87919.1 polyphosphate polymerase domain-containing protein [Bacillota bacterium]HKM16771.1 polyphosphate polymerase domain-containing protein [Limnochordia bacterium]